MFYAAEEELEHELLNRTREKISKRRHHSAFDGQMTAGKCFALKINSINDLSSVLTEICTNILLVPVFCIAQGCLIVIITVLNYTVTLLH